MKRHHPGATGKGTIRVLTVRQPWAERIVSGTKKIEYRTWQTHYRGALAIHAAVSRAAPGGTDLPRGVIVGTVKVVDCVIGRDGIWHWKLRQPRRCRPISFKGSLGIRLLPNRVARRLHKT